MKKTLELNLKHTPIYTKQYEALTDKSIRFIVHQGGSRSSKTYSILQSLIVYALTNKNQTISIVRKSFPALRSSVMKDFFEILTSLGIYNENNHWVNESVYKFKNGSEIEFFSVDDAQKLRGRKRHILYANEANELSFEEFQQLNLRTETKLVFDFNPSDNYSFLYELMDRPKALKIHSTYKDNSFLNQDQIDEIEGLKDVDLGFYRVYALGEQAPLKENVFTHQTIGEFIDSDQMLYGLDIGYNHPTALVAISVIDKTLHCKEIIYSRSLTNTDLIALIRQSKILPDRPIICDSARPDVIEELRRAGYKAIPAIKNVKEGITAMKSYKIVIDPASINMIKEFRNYKYKMIGDTISEEVLKIWDDSVDGVRYSFYWWYLKNGRRRERPSFDFTSIDM